MTPDDIESAQRIYSISERFLQGERPFILTARFKGPFTVSPWSDSKHQATNKRPQDNNQDTRINHKNNDTSKNLNKTIKYCEEICEDKDQSGQFNTDHNEITKATVLDEEDKTLPYDPMLANALMSEEPGEEEQKYSNPPAIKSEKVAEPLGKCRHAVLSAFDHPSLPLVSDNAPVVERRLSATRYKVAHPPTTPERTPHAVSSLHLSPVSPSRSKRRKQRRRKGSGSEQPSVTPRHAYLSDDDIRDDWSDEEVIHFPSKDFAPLFQAHKDSPHNS